MQVVEFCQKTTKRQGKDFERYARIPKDQLLDMLFSLFAEKQSWSFKDLRLKTEQPAEYLKEVLNMIAFLHRSGDLNGQYSLLENYRDQESQNSVRELQFPNLNENRSFLCVPQIKFENDMGQGEISPDMDGEDDDDMEEVE
jgi:transcription initiation factor TFIIF subunit beta